MPVTVPERTIDAWCSIYFSRTFPRMRLWLPTSGWDQALDPGISNAKVVLTETKTSTRVAGHQRISIRKAQLDAYLASPVASRALYYVLPQFPARDYGVPSSVSRIQFPPHSASWSFAPFKLLHVVSCYELGSWLLAHRPTLHSGNYWLRADDIPRMPGARSLVDFCDDIVRCRAGWPVGTFGGRDFPAQFPASPGPPREVDERFHWDDAPIQEPLMVDAEPQVVPRPLGNGRSGPLAFVIPDGS